MLLNMITCAEKIVHLKNLFCATSKPAIALHEHTFPCNITWSSVMFFKLMNTYIYIYIYIYIYMCVSNKALPSIIKSQNKMKINLSCPDVFCKKGALKNYLRFTGKRLCCTLLFNNVAR